MIIKNSKWFYHFHPCLEMLQLGISSGSLWKDSLVNLRLSSQLAVAFIETLNCSL